LIDGNRSARVVCRNGIEDRFAVRQCLRGPLALHA
jgi:hypothetical protein